MDLVGWKRHNRLPTGGGKVKPPSVGNATNTQSVTVIIVVFVFAIIIIFGDPKPGNANNYFD